MYSSLLIALLPLLIGWLIPIRSKVFHQGINRCLGWMVYVILFFMGISLAFLDNLSANLLSILKITTVCVCCILICNALALRLLDIKLPWQHNHKQEQLPSRFRMILESLQLCGVVLAGFLLGLSHWEPLHYATKAGEYALILLLLLVGMQLRGSGLTFTQILFNRRGMLVAGVVVFSSFCGGIISAKILDLPLTQGLALASGFGWYSLSGILLTDALGPVLGSSAFFNDLFRELIAIMCIPTLMHRYRGSALGLSGATSMDFTLPVLQRAGGMDIVPAAIVHGFILSLLAPVLMGFFAFL